MIKKLISYLTKPKGLFKENGKWVTKGENSTYSWTAEWTQDHIGNWFVLERTDLEKKYE